MALDKHFKEGERTIYGVEVMNSSFIPTVRYWFENEAAMLKFSDSLGRSVDPAFIRRVRTYHPRVCLICGFITDADICPNCGADTYKKIESEVIL